MGKVASKEERIEAIIIKKIIENKHIRNVLLPAIKDKTYFLRNDLYFLFDLIKSHVRDYNVSPTYDELRLKVSGSKNHDLVPFLDKLENCKIDLSSIECFYKDVTKSIIKNRFLSSLQNYNDTQNYNEIYKKMQNIVGFDLLNSKIICYQNEDIIKEQFKYYSENTGRRISLGIFDDFVGGSVYETGIHIFLGGTNIGKTAFLCNVAKESIDCGNNTLFITLEESTQKIMNRIDGVVTKINVNDFKGIDKNKYLGLRGREKKKGNLYLLQSNYNDMDLINFESILERTITDDLNIGVVVIDYLKLINTRGLNTDKVYDQLGEITMKLRAYLQKHDMVGFSAMQLNRSGSKIGYDPSLTDISDGWSINFSADLVVLLSEISELGEGGERNWEKSGVQQGASSGEISKICATIGKTRYNKNKNSKIFFNFNRGTQALIKEDF